MCQLPLGKMYRSVINLVTRAWLSGKAVGLRVQEQANIFVFLFYLKKVYHQFVNISSMHIAVN